MAFQSKITSKGQVTVPVEIRRKLGLKRGDRVEFREHGGETVIARAAETKSPFAKYAGILRKKFKAGFDSIEWQRDLRDEH
jgi:AbrB family looped-hinge helix DNA binding protein